MTRQSAAGLTHEQRQHFTEHGWVVLEGVLDADACEAYIDAIDRDISYFDFPGAITETTSWLMDTHLHGSAYLDWFKLPGIAASVRELMEVDDPRVDGTAAVASKPHPDRATRRDELLDPDRWDWHRDFDRPRNCVRVDPDDPELLTTMVLASITFLTRTSAENGSTALLDGSHRLDGSYLELKQRCPIVHPKVAAGGVLLFAETLLRDEDLRVLLAPPTYGDQRTRHLS